MSVVPESDLPESNVVPPDDLPGDQAVPSHDLPEETSALKAGLNSFMRGATFGLSDSMAGDGKTPYVGKKEEQLYPVIPQSKEELAREQEEHPIVSTVGHIAGSVAALAGPEAATGVTARIAALSAGKKLTAKVIKGFVEGSLLTGGDEVSKAMLGIGDPNDAIGPALTNMGVSGIIGAGVSGALGVSGSTLKAIENSRIGTAAGKFAEDFGSRWRINQRFSNLYDSVSDELNNFFRSTNEHADLVYGSSGLKRQAISKLVPEMNDKITSQNNEIANTLKVKLADVLAGSDDYTPSFRKVVGKDLEEWQKDISAPGVSSSDVFDATQTLKQKFQQYSKYDKTLPTYAPETRNARISQEVAPYLRKTLEDNSVWGKAGDLQAGINKAFVDFKTPNETFISKFGTWDKNANKDVIDPSKVRGYLSGVGNDKAEFRQKYLEQYLDSAEEYRNKIDELHNSLGIESPVSPASTDAMRSTIYGKDTKVGKLSTGAKAADFMFRSAVPAASAKVASGIGGAIVGHLTGIPGAEVVGAYGAQHGADKLTPFFREAFGRALHKSEIPAALRVLSSEDPQAMGEALQYASQVNRGSALIKNSIDNLFVAGSRPVYEHTATDEQKEKLKKFVEEGGVTVQIKNALNNMIKNQPTPAAPAPPPGFAEGGEVQAQPQSQAEPDKPSPDDSNAIARIYPSHNVILQAARARVYNHLNSLRPQEKQAGLPYDYSHEPSSKHDKTYDSVVDLALHPLKILNRIKDGSLAPADLKHFGTMYPELHDHLSKQLTKKIMDQQIKGERPDYKMRQGLSLFLGAPVDSSFKPMNIIAAQMTFVKQQQPPPQGKTGKLDKASKSYQTGAQAAQSRQVEDR